MAGPILVKMEHSERHSDVRRDRSLVKQARLKLSHDAEEIREGDFGACR